MLLAEFDDGEITSFEYQKGLGDLIGQEIIIHVAAAESRVQKMAPGKTPTLYLPW